MADVLHFDTEKALDNFLIVFWEKGYKSTTTKELARIAGISEGSLFHTFRNKRDIYIRSLKRYSENGKRLVAKMENNESALEGIKDYWSIIGKMAADSSRSKGCMITNATTENLQDPEVVDYLQTVHTRYDAQFKKELDRAVSLGELCADADTTALAQFLSCTLQGIRVLARLNPSQEKVNNILKLSMSAIYQYRK